jgi:hypothetical protein
MHQYEAVSDEHEQGRGQHVGKVLRFATACTGALEIRARDKASTFGICHSSSAMLKFCEQVAFTE